MSKDADTDLPTEYTAEDERHMAAMAQAAGNQADGVSWEDADGFEVTADVEWEGSTNANPHRTLRVKGDGTDLKGVAKAVRGLLDPANPRLPSYRASGWQAQYKALQKTAGGREALAEHLRVSAKTQGRWSSGKQAPGRASQEAIKAAYEARATDPKAVATATAKANHRVAEAITQVMRDRFDDHEIRLTKITRLDLTKDD